MRGGRFNSNFRKEDPASGDQRRADSLDRSPSRDTNSSWNTSRPQPMLRRDLQQERAAGEQPTETADESPSRKPVNNQKEPVIEPRGLL